MSIQYFFGGAVTPTIGCVDQWEQPSKLGNLLFGVRPKFPSSGSQMFRDSSDMGGLWCLNIFDVQKWMQEGFNVVKQ